MKQRFELSTEARQRILWYDNHHMNYEVMKTYYPKFYDRIKEMQAIIYAQGYMLDEAEMAIEIVLNNMYIISMDEKNVSDLETFLSIVPRQYKTLDDRKNVLLSHFRGNGSISLSQLVSVVKTICDGECSGTLKSVDSNGNRGVVFNISDFDMRDTIKEVISAIQLHIPAHLWFEIFYTPTYIISCSSAVVSISASLENTAIVSMLIYDGGDLTKNVENIFDGGSLTAVTENIIDFNY